MSTTLNQDYQQSAQRQPTPTIDFGASAGLRQDEMTGNRRGRRYRAAFWCLAIALGLLQAWANRLAIDPDGVNYLDMAKAYFRGDWKMALNAYWSPLYSWLLGASLSIFKPSPYWESTLVHLVNFAIYLLALGCFEFFLSAVIRSQHAAPDTESSPAPLPEWALWALGYTLFLFSSLEMISLGLVKPDLCVAAVVYLAAGIVVRIHVGETRWRTYAFLGLVLAIGYLTKSVMFPLAFVFLGVSLFAAGRFHWAVRHTLLALAVFLLVSGPFIVALSRAKGRLTFGDTGRLAYARYVSGIERYSHWQGAGTTAVTLKHPPRKVFSVPPVYEFATPIGGTYPPWYDPSYWLEGLSPAFNLKGQFAVLRQSAAEYFRIFSAQREWLVGVLALILLEGRWGLFAKRFARQWHQWLPPAAACAMYLLVLVEARYVAAFVVLLWCALLAALRLPRSQASRRFVQCIVIAVLLVVGVKMANATGHDLAQVLRPPAHVQWQVAEGLRHMGIQRGDKVASVGHSTVADYWAHLAGVQIVADIPLEGAASFWTASLEVKSKVAEIFAGAGAKVMVTNAVPPFVSPDGWLKIGDTNYFVLVLPRAGAVWPPFTPGHRAGRHQGCPDLSAFRDHGSGNVGC